MYSYRIDRDSHSYGLGCNHTKSPFRRMMKISLKGVISALILFTQVSFANIVINDDKILSDGVVEKISTLGNELKAKSGIYVGLGVYENLNSKNLNDFFKELDLQPPYAFLLLAKSEHRVEIFADEATAKLFNKDQILSPYPSSGSILPILTSKNSKDIYNASMLNGYADLVEQIASSRGIKLENAVGSQNKLVLDSLRVIIYGMVGLAVLVVISAKFRGKNA